MDTTRRRTIALVLVAAFLPLQYAINAAILTSHRISVPSLLWLAYTASGFLVPLAGGIVGGLVVAAFRRELRLQARVMLSWRWIATTLVIFAISGVLAWLYSVLKITAHATRGVSYDALLWKIDSWLLLGASPNIFFLELLAHPLAYRAIDFLYVGVFTTTITASFVLMFGWRRNDDRIAYLVGSVILWLGGAWLYYALPSLGPAYAFYEVWDAVREDFPRAMFLQKTLLDNHMRLLRLAAGEIVPRPVNVYLGIGAFPSLHVGFHVYFALWLQRLIPRLRIVGWVLVIVVAVGSVVTGWHYLVDSIAGGLLALGAYVAVVPLLEKTSRESGVESPESATPAS